MKRLSTLLIFSLWLLHSFSAFTQVNEDRAVYLQNDTIPAESPKWLAGKNARIDLRSAESQPILGIMRFDRHLTAEDKSFLAERGIHVQSYIPNYAWVVVVAHSFEGAELQPTGFAGMTYLTPEMKADPDLLTGSLPPHASVEEGYADLWVRFPDFFPADTVKKLLIEEGVEIRSDLFKKFNILAIRLPIGNIRALADLYFIDFIQAQPAPDKPENSVSIINSRANTMRSPYGPLTGGLAGRGVVIGVGDETDPLRHIDFAGRLINRFSNIDGNGHGLHTMGTIAGGGIIREELAGYAPKSTVISQYYSNIIASAVEFYSDFGMRLTNNSYGSSTTLDQSFRRYNLVSAAIDKMSADMPDMLHVFAAGNSGNLQIAGSPYQSSLTGEIGFGTVLSNYQSAKNTLVVGNVNANYVRAPTSSRGPVSNGRLKPEVVALGTSVRSTTRDDSYGVLSGTSMATPAVTGGAALLIEQFKAQFPSSGQPSSAFLKALICNGASDLGTTGPDYSHGYGAMNLYRSSEMLKNNHFRTGSVITGSTQTGTINIPPNTAQLKVMLCWTDAPGNPISSKSLVNDLDLTLDGGGGPLLPYLNNSQPAFVKNAANTDIDRDNNIEQVVIYDPSEGNVSFSVRGFNIPSGPQQYVLVYDIIPAGTTLTAPFGGEKYLPGDQVSIHWDSYGEATNFHLEYYNGSDWVRIATNLGEATRQFTWTVPNNLAVKNSKVRIVRVSDNQIITSSDFIIIARPTVTLANDNLQCEGMITINWTNVPNATGYEVMKLESDQMVVINTVPSSQTSYSFTGLSSDSTYWVSVRAVWDGVPGLRGIAISRRPENGGCEATDSVGDFAVVSLTSPSRSGRLLTSSALSSTQSVKFRIKNLDSSTSPQKTAVATYSINGNSQVIENIVLPPLAPQAEHEIEFAAKADLSAIGEYRINIGIDIPGDPTLENNQLVTTISQLPNAQVTLIPTAGTSQFSENLESLKDSIYYKNHIGLRGATRYDFESTEPGGRLRSFLNSGIARSGSRAITLDANDYPHTHTVNYLSGTYNLDSYDVDQDDIRLDFWYMHHGQFDDNQNRV